MWTTKEAPDSEPSHYLDFILVMGSLQQMFSCSVALNLLAILYFSVFRLTCLIIQKSEKKKLTSIGKDVCKMGKQTNGETAKTAKKYKELEEQAKIGHILAKGVCNILLAVILLGIGCDLVFRTSALEDPVNVNGNVADLGVYILLAFCLFNMALILTGVTTLTNTNKYILLSQYSVGALTLIAIGTTRQNSGALVVALFMVGDVVFAESRSMLRARSDKYRQTSIYKVALFYHFTGAMIFRIALPTLILTVIGVYQHWKLLKMSPVSVTIFFIAISFYCIINIWTVKIVFTALLKATKTSRDDVIESQGLKRVHAEPNMYVELQSTMVNPEYRPNNTNSLPARNERKSIDTTMTVLDFDNLSMELENDTLMNVSTMNLYNQNDF